MIRHRFFRACSAIVLFAVLAMQIPQISLAAVASPASDTLSRQEIGVAANHEIVFRTPTGVNASSDTITVDLSDFDFGSVAIGDIDLFHGTTTGLEITDTLAGSAAAGVWGVSIASEIITFTAPTDASALTVPANNRIGIRIGTNAVGGTNQLTNPAGAMIATVPIAGTFGDTASIRVPIIANDEVTVTATVVATSTGGGGGGGSGDTVSPIISGVQALNITTSTATIVWNTNENANSIVEYGLTISYASGTVSDPVFVVAHSIDLSSLTPNTLYHFRVQSLDTVGNAAVSGDFTFTTLADAPPPDTSAPVISNIQVLNITDTAALITWDTNEPATSLVNYGTTVAYGSNASVAGLVTSHAVQLNSLSPATLYHFFITSIDGASNAATSTDQTFTTLADTTSPTNVQNLSATPGDTIVTLSWINPTDIDFAATRIIRQTGGFPTGPFDGTLVYDGTATSTVDTGLTNGVTYFYGAYAHDSSGNFASGALASATPVGPVIVTPEDTDALCSNGLDDDGDSTIDCFDSSCSALPVCAPPPTPTPEDTNASCSNGVDDDLDTQIDCADLGCAALPVCLTPIPPTPTPTSTGPIPEPSPEPGEPGAIIPEYYGSGGAISLIPDASGAVGVLAGSSVLVSVPTNNLGAAVVSVTFSIGDGLYSLQPNGSGTAYSGTFIAPSPGMYGGRVVVTFDNETARDVTTSIRSQSGGQIVEDTLAGPSAQGVPLATIQLFREQNGVWSPYGSEQLTNENGGFAYVVPNGRYYIESTKEGYRKAVGTPVSITQNVYNVGLSMIRVPVIQEIPSDAPLAEQVSIAVSNVTIQAEYAVEVAREILQSPVVQETAAVAAPTLLAVTIVNAASAISAFNALAYFQYLFTQPLLLFGRRRRKQWGVVYNSLTKQPVDLAIVRLLQAETRLVIQTKVSDKEGRYAFLVKKGKYLLEVVKPAYVFPTQHLVGRKEDADYADLYHGEAIEITEDGLIVRNIPLDPITSTETPRRVLWKKGLQTLRHSLAFSGIPIGMFTLIISPGVITALLLLAQVGVYLLFRRVAVPTKAKNWGVAFDAKTRKPLSGAVVRVFDKKFNKLLESQVTDSNGKYGFFVRRNVYYVMADKAGYERFVSPDLDLSDKDQALIAQNIPMKPKLATESKTDK